jgi:hypothetical protein
MKSCSKIPQYNIYHPNHPDGNAHAGTAVIVKQTISHYELPKYAENFLQATPIQVKTLPYELTVTAVYSPPKYNPKKNHYDSISARWARDSWQEKTIIVKTLFGVLV